ncbi:MAG: phytanoyl-CoA dioxygenase family protein [Verrucomicrobiota bacterium]|nr:phytanoyl-CoA dioxygenase family protein [Verrucomicrobiota bacterium]
MTTPQLSTFSISDQDVEFYKENGYLMLGKVMSDETLEKFRALIPTLPKRPEDKGTFFYTQLRGKHPLIMDFATEGNQIEAMKKLIGPNLRCWFDQFVVKAPDTADKARNTFPWHQDNGYGGLEPGTNITVWFALDDVTPDNGCVWVVPGSHKKGLIPHIKKSEDSWHIEVDVEGNGTPANLKAGEAIAFTGYTLHRSLQNQTNNDRRAFFLEYCDADALDKGTPINQHPPDAFYAGGMSPVICGVSKYNP